MGKVVDIESRTTDPQSARRGRGSKKPSKTALVLGGGGFTGGVYEIGALRALDLLATNRTINQFDVYVGTSAGAFIASLTANGVTPEEMMRVLNRNLASPLRDIDLGTLLRPNYRGFLEKSLTLPLRLAGAVRELAADLGEVSLVDIGAALSSALPGRPLHRRRDRALRPRGARRPRPHERLPAARERALPRRDRPRHDRADHHRRGRVGRRPDLLGRRRLGRPAGHLRAGRDPRPRADRRRHPLDHERRRRGRARGEVRRRHQPAGPVRQRLPQEHPDVHRQPRPARLRHGRRRDPQPDLPPALPRSPPPRGRDLGGALSRASTSS